MADDPTPENAAGFRPGRNVAIKVPERHYAATVAFYRDTLGFGCETVSEDLAVIDFGAIRLSLDRVPHQSQADVWLEVLCDDTRVADDQLKAAGAARCDEVEPLPEGMDAFWIAAPAGTIHLVRNPGEND